MTTPPPRSGSYGRVTTGSAARSTSSSVQLTHEPTDAAMRAARRRWASGVAVLTTFEDVGEERRLRGATVGSFTIVSLDPPLVLACLERETASARMISISGVFAVSILDLRHESLADRFAGYGPMPDAMFTGIPYDIAATGAPVLTGSSAWFDCQIHATHDGGDHLIVVGAVVAVGRGEETDDPLVSYEGAYRRLEGA